MDVDRFFYYLFILSLVLVLVAYFAGVQTEATTFFKGLGYIGNVFTGRNPKTGKFAPYPGNAPTSAAG